MALKIVGSGLGRTGTKSMQTALNMLGFGPCHHMVEVFQHPESMALWVEASKGKDVWDEIFKDYQSAVDYPVAAYWREVAAKYPDAKVLHTTRDADKWFEFRQLDHPLAQQSGHADADRGRSGRVLRERGRQFARARC